MVNWNISSLRKYVALADKKDESQLRKASFEWMKVSAKNRIDYEIEWLGIPIIQTAEDMVLMQELIFKIKPDFIIETGIAHGGSLIFYASLFEILGKGQVIGVDIDIRSHNRAAIEAHPLYKRIQMIEGNSISEDVMQKISDLVGDKSINIVSLDSNHYRDHVLKELIAYKRFVNVGSYFVVADTITSALTDDGSCPVSYKNNDPMEAVHDFLSTDKDFIIDKHFNRLWISTSPDGYLKRVK